MSPTSSLGGRQGFRADPGGTPLSVPLPIISLIRSYTSWVESPTRTILGLFNALAASLQAGNRQRFLCLRRDEMFVNGLLHPGHSISTLCPSTAADRDRSRSPSSSVAQVLETRNFLSHVSSMHQMHAFSLQKHQMHASQYSMRKRNCKIEQKSHFRWWYVQVSQGKI